VFLPPKTMFDGISVLKSYGISYFDEDLVDVLEK
jgi:hypothetical protein